MNTIYASLLTRNGRNIFVGDKEYDADSKTNTPAEQPFIMEVKDIEAGQLPEPMAAWYGKERLTLGKQVQGEFGPGQQYRGSTLLFTAWFRENRNGEPILAVTRFRMGPSEATLSILDDLGL